MNYLLLWGAYHAGWGWTRAQWNWRWVLFALCAALTVLLLSAAFLASGLTSVILWLSQEQRQGWLERLRASSLTRAIQSLRQRQGLRWLAVEFFAVIVVLCVGTIATIGIIGSHTGKSVQDHWFMLERSLIVTSGVSSFYPMFLLVVAGAALVFNRLNDLYLLKQHMPRYLEPSDMGLWQDDPMWKTDTDLHKERNQYAQVVEKLGQCLIPRSGTHLVTLAVAVVYALFVLFSVVDTRASGSMEAVIFDFVFRVLAIVLFGFVVLNTIRLTLMWRSLRRIIKHFLHLPVGPSLYRMSTRTARWFFEPPGPDQSRFDLIKRQARTLADQCKPEILTSGKTDRDSVNSEWTRIIESTEAPGQQWGDRITIEQRWGKLRRQLESVSLETIFNVRAMLFPVLLRYWKGLDLQEAYPDMGPPAGSTTPAAASASARPDAGAAAADGSEPTTPVADVSLDAWGEAATDLLSLLLVS
jgi:hypothetical protein